MKNPRARINLRGTSGSSNEALPSLIVFASFVLVIACLYWAQAVLIPVALSIMLTFPAEPGRQGPRMDRCRTSSFSHPYRRRHLFPPGYDWLGC